jgi:hypothetical protein
MLVAEVRIQRLFLLDDKVCNRLMSRRSGPRGARCYSLSSGSCNAGSGSFIRDADFSLMWIVNLAERKFHYCCTVITVPACVVKPLYVAIVGWSPLGREGGTTTLN